jgi:hypothetical protein
MLFTVQASSAQQTADGTPILVGISEAMKFADVNHQGSIVRVTRSQDQENKLSGDYTKASRACPPFCIQPLVAAPGVDTVGELEPFDFINTVVRAAAMVC